MRSCETHSQVAALVACVENALSTELLHPLCGEVRRCTEFVDLVPGAVAKHVADRLESAWWPHRALSPVGQMSCGSRLYEGPERDATTKEFPRTVTTLRPFPVESRHGGNSAGRGGVSRTKQGHKEA